MKTRSVNHYEITAEKIRHQAGVAWMESKPQLALRLEALAVEAERQERGRRSSSHGIEKSRKPVNDVGHKVHIHTRILKMSSPWRL